MRVLKLSGIFAPGRITVKGTPRTIGSDPFGQLCIWFEEGEADECLIAFTGDDITGWRVIDTTVYDGLVWHLCVQAN